MAEESTTSLGATAGWTAAARAAESTRRDALFTDPWAAALAGEEARAWAAARPPEKLATMVVRTRFFDDFLTRATRDRGIRQVVLLAAGLDTRAFRLDWPAGTAVHELDRADVLRRKDAVLGEAGAVPRCERRVATSDLALPGWPDDLRGLGFDPSLPSAWLAEGILFYLPSPTLAALLDRVSGLSAPGSALGFDVVNHDVLTHPLTRPWVRLQAEAGAPWIGTLDDPVRFLARRGWRATLSQCGAPDAHYGRWSAPVLPVSAPDLPHHWLVLADRPAQAKMQDATV